jgi:uncharacterized membrane protein
MFAHITAMMIGIIGVKIVQTVFVIFVYRLVHNDKHKRIQDDI